MHTRKKFERNSCYIVKIGGVVLNRIWLAVIIGSIFSCGPSLQELEFVKIKSVHKKLFAPTPFVICLKDGKVDTTAAKTITNFVKEKMEEMVNGQLDVIHFNFETFESYTEYGKELSKLVVELEKRNKEEVSLSPKLIDIVNKSNEDLSIFVYQLADPKSKSQRFWGTLGIVALGTTVGVLTGFSPIVVGNMVSSKMHVIIYSKSKNCIISYEDEEDKDNPLEKKYTHEQFETLFQKFANAGKTQEQ